MIDVRQTEIFRQWLDDLADRKAAERIAQRVVRVRNGLMGDVKSVGDGVSDCASMLAQAIGCILPKEALF